MRQRALMRSGVGRMLCGRVRGLITAPGPTWRLTLTKNATLEAEGDLPPRRVRAAWCNRVPQTADIQWLAQFL